MDIQAKLRYLRMSPRKVRLVADVIRGLPAREAEVRLSFLPKAAALPVRKLLASAVANAEHNFKLAADTLRVKTILVDGGPVLKRYRPRAMGRAAEIKKRTSHIILVLTDEARPPKAKRPALTKKKAIKPRAQAATAA